MDSKLQPVVESIVGRYRLGKELGRGGMGIVFEATHLDLGKVFAIKVLHPHLGADARARERFVREVRALARLRHPHIVSVCDAGVRGDELFLVMEYEPGETLACLLRSMERTEYESAVDLILPVISAIAHSHSEGIIHRDIKPSNILLSYDYCGTMLPKVADFGISRIVDASGESNLTSPGGLLGTGAYVSPEQAVAPSQANHLSDQYSLGVVLYQCLAGQLPHEAPLSEDALVARRLREPARGLRQIVSSIPAGLDLAVMRSLHPDPSFRFSSVQEFGAALLPYASHRSQLLWGSEFRPAAGASLRSEPMTLERAPEYADGTHTFRPTAIETSQPDHPTFTWFHRGLSRRVAYCLCVLLGAAGVMGVQYWNASRQSAVSIPQAVSTLSLSLVRPMQAWLGSRAVAGVGSQASGTGCSAHDARLAHDGSLPQACVSPDTSSKAAVPSVIAKRVAEVQRNSVAAASVGRNAGVGPSDARGLPVQPLVLPNGGVSTAVSSVPARAKVTVGSNGAPIIAD